MATRIIETLDDISAGFDAALCDLSGCLHDGVNSFCDAAAALTRFQERGDVVLRLTNSPRPATRVEEQLERLGVPREIWVAIVPFCGASRRAMFSGAVGKKVWFVGSPADHAFFGPPSEGVSTTHQPDSNMLDSFLHATTINPDFCTGHLR